MNKRATRAVSVAPLGPCPLPGAVKGKFARRGGSVGPFLVAGGTLEPLNE